MSPAESRTRRQVIRKIGKRGENEPSARSVRAIGADLKSHPTRQHGAGLPNSCKIEVPPEGGIHLGRDFFVGFSHHSQGRLQRPEPAQGRRHARDIQKHGVAVSAKGTGSGLAYPERLWWPPLSRQKNRRLIATVRFCVFAEIAPGAYTVLRYTTFFLTRKINLCRSSVF